MKTIFITSTIKFFYDFDSPGRKLMLQPLLDYIDSKLDFYYLREGVIQKKNQWVKLTLISKAH